VKKLSLTIGVMVLFVGCSGKNEHLFKNEDSSYISQSKEININYDSKIMPDDILNIDVYNMNQKSNILKNSTLLSADAVKENSEYIVTADGTIYLPLLQEVKVQGYTVKELSKELTSKYRRYLKQPYSKVSIKNHKIYVLGEVNKQGIVPMEGNMLSVIEAISHSGGLTDHAMQNRVHIISKEGGKHKIRTLDLTKLSTLNVDNIMLKHGSIVYVEPTSSKALSVGVKDYLPILQVISSLASTFLTIDYISGGN
jgi:polysaccharide export outer membrane protein